jgi:hypothetical protein
MIGHRRKKSAGGKIENGTLNNRGTDPISINTRAGVSIASFTGRRNARLAPAHEQIIVRSAPQASSQAWPHGTFQSG